MSRVIAIIIQTFHVFERIIYTYNYITTCNIVQY